MRSVRIYQDITYSAAMTVTERKSDFKLTTDTPYLALTGELWGAYYENFEENWPYCILELIIWTRNT